MKKKWLKYALIIIGVVVAFHYIIYWSLVLTEESSPSVSLLLLLIIISLVFWAIHKSKVTEDLESEIFQKNLKLQEEAEELEDEVKEMIEELRELADLIIALDKAVGGEKRETKENIKIILESIYNGLKIIKKKVKRKVELIEHEI